MTRQKVTLSFIMPANVTLNLDSPASIEDGPELNLSEARAAVKRNAPSTSTFAPPPAKAIEFAKEKADLTLAADTMLIQTLQSLEKTNEEKETEEADRDLSFCKSLVTILKGLSTKKIDMQK